jgi:hypothetical protein
MIGGFVGGGLITIKGEDNIKWQLFGYNLLVLIAILIVVYVSWF